jgi:hypothetical protein
MLGSLIGGIAGNLFDNGDEDAQKAAYQNALKAIQDVNVPTIDEQRIALEKLESQGELTPEMVDAISQGDTNLKNISTDPRLKDTQMQALQKLVQQGSEGLTASDRAAITQINRGVDRDAEARNASILQNMAQRGMSGSGAELAAQLASSQQAMDSANTQGNNLAAQATQRALEATTNAGNLGGQIRSQDYGEAANAAQAQDAIDRFNAANRQQVMSGNVAARNNAQASNLANKQNIANQNVGLANQQEMYNKGLYQQQFNNQMTKAKGIAAQDNTLAGYYGQQAANTRGMWSGIGSAVDQGAQAAFAGGMFGGAGTGVESAKPAGFMGPMPEKTTSPNYGAILSDKNAKKNITDGTNAIEDFLDKLHSANYEYKDPNHSPGINTGVIAQDVEKSHVGKNMVSETPEGKQIDVKKGVAAMMAATANLHHRLRKLEGSKQ